jgi:hypothetical protein
MGVSIAFFGPYEPMYGSLQGGPGPEALLW